MKPHDVDVTSISLVCPVVFEVISYLYIIPLKYISKSTQSDVVALDTGDGNCHFDALGRITASSHKIVRFVTLSSANTRKFYTALVVNQQTKFISQALRANPAISFVIVQHQQLAAIISWNISAHVAFRTHGTVQEIPISTK